MIREQKAKQSNIFDATIRDRPEEWTRRVWREVYEFLPGGSRMANRTDQYVEGKFLHDVDPKDGFPVRECRDAWERRVLEFLVPIVHLDKPTRVTCTLGNTIFGALNVGLSTCPSVCVSWIGLSSIRLALGLQEGKLGVTPTYVADTSHSKWAPPKHEHALRLTRRRAWRWSRAHVVACSSGRMHT